MIDFLDKILETKRKIGTLAFMTPGFSITIFILILW